MALDTVQKKPDPNPPKPMPRTNAYFPGKIILGPFNDCVHTVTWNVVGNKMYIISLTVFTPFLYSFIVLYMVFLVLCGNSVLCGTLRFFAVISDTLSIGAKR